MQAWVNGKVVQYTENLGFCEGNNRAAALAGGEFLFFLNNDTWLEPDCLEKLLEATISISATAACPLVLNYEDASFQSAGAGGFDIFGLATARSERGGTSRVLMPEGCAYLIRRERFFELGQFDPKFFMFAEEYDLSWRVWIGGGSAMVVPAARLHHRGAAQVNPAGGGEVVEFRTSDTKRYYANRNNLVVLLKNCQHLLLLLVPLQLLLLGAEAIAGLLLVRRWSFVRRAYLDAIVDCWKLRSYIAAQRRFVKGLRKRGDFWMLRFLRARPNRWDELVRAAKHGIPKVSEK
jgi:GT2 family glycosyltransferase